MKIIKKVEQGRYINQIEEMENGTYCIMHAEKDLMYGPDCACWSQSYEGLSLEEAHKKLKEVTGQ